nr:unnamed protein product [Spirometra erinaceieuropaei]
MRLLIVDKVAPNFVTEYEHTRHHLTCDFKTLKVRLHQEAILALITFSNELVQMLSTANEGPASAAPASASTADYEAEWARRLGDKEGMRSAQERKLELQPTHTDIRLMDSQTTPMEAVTGIMSRKDERRQIRLDAAFRAAAAG